MCFFSLWLLLKVYKGAWSPWNTLDAERVKILIKELNDLRDISLEQPVDDIETPRLAWIWKAFGRNRNG